MLQRRAWSRPPSSRRRSMGVNMILLVAAAVQLMCGRTSVVVLAEQQQQNQPVQQYNRTTTTTTTSSTLLRPTNHTTVIEETPEDQLGPFYLPDSCQTMILGPMDEIADPLRRLQVTGQVISTITCEGLRNIIVEVWFAGPPDANGNYYQPNDYRGQITTDAYGYYNWTQTFPALYPERPILHDHIRLSRQPVSNNNTENEEEEELLVTQMYFYAEGNNTNATEENGYVTQMSSQWDIDPLQVVTIVRDSTSGARSVLFNMYLDITNPNSTTTTTNETTTIQPSMMNSPNPAQQSPFPATTLSPLVSPPPVTTPVVQPPSSSYSPMDAPTANTTTNTTTLENEQQRGGERESSMACGIIANGGGINAILLSIFFSFLILR